MSRIELLDDGTSPDGPDEPGLRPRSLADFVGQAELKEHLAIVLEAAKRRGQPADHLLLAGPHVLERDALVAEDGNVAGAGPVRLLELTLQRAAGEFESRRVPRPPHVGCEPERRRTLRRSGAVHYRLLGCEVACGAKTKGKR